MKTKIKEIHSLINNSDIKGLKKYFKTNDIHYKNDYALKFAVSEGNYDVVELLLKLDVDIHTDNNYSILVAAKKDYSDIVILLAENDADVHANEDEVLRYAILNRNKSLITFLMNFDMDIHIQDNLALVKAAEINYFEIIYYLLEYDKMNNNMKYDLDNPDEKVDLLEVLRSALSHGNVKAVTNLLGHETYSESFPVILNNAIDDFVDVECIEILLNKCPEFKISKESLMYIFDNDEELYKLLRDYKEM